MNVTTAVFVFVMVSVLLPAMLDVSRLIELPREEGGVLPVLGVTGVGTCNVVFNADGNEEGVVTA